MAWHGGRRRACLAEFRAREVFRCGKARLRRGNADGNGSLSVAQLSQEYCRECPAGDVLDN
jgi:hypothetical protein